MKKIVSVLILLLSISLYAQDSCNTYIDFMTNAVKQNNIEKAKSDMEAFIACKEESFGIDNPKIKILDEIEYIKYSFNEKEKNYFIVTFKNSNEAILDYNFNIIKEFKNEKLIYDFYIYDLLFCHDNKNDKQKIIDKQGLTISDYYYFNTSTRNYNNMLVRVSEFSKDDKVYGAVNIKTGKLVIPIEYDDLHFSHDSDLINVRKNKKWGYLDVMNNIVIPFNYSYAYYFQGGLAAVTKNKKFGFIDTTGKLIIPYRYDSSGGFFIDGICNVTINEKDFYINKQGQCVKDCENAPADHPRANN